MKSNKNDVYWDASHYDWMHQNHQSDFTFLEKLLKKVKGPILELACGTGRVTLYLARKGFEVWGLDISPEMLAMAEEKRDEMDNARFFLGDCTKFNLDQKFEFIFIPFNSLAHVYDSNQIKGFFRSVKKHLLPEGKLLIDIFNPSPRILSRDSTQRYPVANYIIPETGEKVELTENNVYDSETQINHIKWYYKIADKKEIIKNLPMRMYYPQELNYLIESNGMVIENKWGDYQFNKFNKDSVHQLILCSKKVKK